MSTGSLPVSVDYPPPRPPQPARYHLLDVNSYPVVRPRVITATPPEPTP